MSWLDTELSRRDVLRLGVRVGSALAISSLLAREVQAQEHELRTRRTGWKIIHLPPGFESNTSHIEWVIPQPSPADEANVVRMTGDYSEKVGIPLGAMTLAFDKADTELISVNGLMGAKGELNLQDPTCRVGGDVITEPNNDRIKTVLVWLGAVKPGLKITLSNNDVDGKGVDPKFVIDYAMARAAKEVLYMQAGLFPEAMNDKISGATSDLLGGYDPRLGEFGNLGIVYVSSHWNDKLKINRAPGIGLRQLDKNKGMLSFQNPPCVPGGGEANNDGHKPWFMVPEAVVRAGGAVSFVENDDMKDFRRNFILKIRNGKFISTITD